jgi:hypothetical protein
MLYPYPPRCSALYQKLRNQPDTVKGAITDRSNTQWQCDLSINRTDVQPVGFSRDMGIGNKELGDGRMRLRPCVS